MAEDSGVRQGAKQGSTECRAVGNQRGLAAAVDSGAQGRCEAGLDGRCGSGSGGTGSGQLV